MPDDILYQTCPECNGEGMVSEEVCNTCDGEGKILREYEPENKN